MKRLGTLNGKAIIETSDKNIITKNQIDIDNLKPSSGTGIEEKIQNLYDSLPDNVNTFLCIDYPGCIGSAIHKYLDLPMRVTVTESYISINNGCLYTESNGDYEPVYKKFYTPYNDDIRTASADYEDTGIILVGANSNSISIFGTNDDSGDDYQYTGTEAVTILTNDVQGITVLTKREFCEQVVNRLLTLV